MRAPSALVGRERDLAEIAATLDQVEAGRGGVVLVAGEPGIGKTRLLEEAARQGDGRGFAVTWGRAWELGGAPVFWPWVEALRGLARHVPDLPAPRLGADAETERFQLFDDVVG